MSRNSNWRRPAIPVTATAWAAAIWCATTCIMNAGAEPIVIGESRTFDSEILGEERTLQIYTPPGYLSGDGRFPVLFLLDAGTRFHHTTGTAASLARSGRIPELIVVGLTNTDRTRDFVPPWTRPDPPEGRRQAAARAGGADTFARFFREELIPWVDSNYRTQPFHILAGHSFGGLFACHVLATAPETFDAYIALSPSVHWDEGLPVERLERLFAERRDLKAFFFANLGNEGGEMQNHFLRLQEALRHHAPEDLRHASQVLIEETHGTIPLSGVEAGLDSLYERWAPPRSLANEGLASTLTHFERLSGEFGYAIQPGEALLNNVGYGLLGNDRTAEAIDAFEHAARLYPGSANVYDSLGEALEAAGRLEDARKQYEKAVGRARELEDQRLAVFEEHLEGVRKRIAGG